MSNILRIPCGNGNCYLICNGTDAILVDTCREKYRQKILDVCQGYHVRLLVLTHGHLDHMENAAFLSQALHIPIAMHRADLELLEDNLKQSLSARSILGKIVLAASIKTFQIVEHIPELVPDVFLKDGDSLDSYGVPDVKVVGLPGHTDGSIGLDVNGRDLIVGDALMNMFYPTVSMLYHDREAMLQSVEKIEKIGPRTIYFGHGKPVENRKWHK
ncbi:MAG: MBL fold metallo-hydrolase [Oscillospiraceae bacterium]|nr:MBL fold metallo-hydrolase [Oscillospiraceae bacterium]